MSDDMAGVVARLDTTLKPAGAAPTFKEAIDQLRMIQNLDGVIHVAAHEELRAVGDTAVSVLLKLLSTESCAPVCTQKAIDSVWLARAAIAQCTIGAAVHAAQRPERTESNSPHVISSSPRILACRFAGQCWHACPASFSAIQSEQPWHTAPFWTR